MSVPIGAKGIGEIGITGAAAAVANAYYRATGKRARDLPITLEKLFRPYDEARVFMPLEAALRSPNATRYTILMPRKLLSIFALLAAAVFAQSNSARVFELRTYHCNEGRLEALKTRFRDHTIEIFKRHGIESIAYWTPQDPEQAKNTLVYLIVHPSREAAKANWAAFLADPEWKKVAADSEKDGKIVQKVDSVFLDPADFSPLK